MKHFPHLAAAAAAAVLISASVAQATELAVAAAAEISLTGSGPGKRIKLLPIGQVKLRDGRGPFFVENRAHAEAIVAATRDFLGVADLMFDYDHQALYAAKPGVGGTAIAAGWARPGSLSVEDDGIYADVDWTEAASAKLASREYRYLSPAFMADPQTKRVLHLKNAALVNIPAIDMPAIAAATGDVMNFANIAAALKLGADAGEDKILATIAALNGAASLVAIAAAAGLPETANAVEIAAAIDTLKTPDPAKFVPVEQVQGLTQQLGVLSGERAERAIAAATETGKLAPALKEWGLSLYKKDETAWNDWLKSAPVIVAAGATLREQPADGKALLTEEQVAAATLLGMSEDEYRDALKLEVA